MRPDEKQVIDEAISGFLASEICPEALRLRVEAERVSEQLRGKEFHDLGAVLVTTVCGFLASIAANIANQYFAKPHLSDQDVRRIAVDAADMIRNEMRLRGGPSAGRIELSEQELDALAQHVLQACERIRKDDR